MCVCTKFAIVSHSVKTPLSLSLCNLVHIHVLVLLSACWHWVDMMFPLVFAIPIIFDKTDSAISARPLSLCSVLIGAGDALCPCQYSCIF